MASDSRGKKRPYQQWKKSGSRNPQRSAPGFLFTCETGRESKCRWEALQILQHEWDQNHQCKQQKALNEKNSAHPDGCEEDANGSTDIKDQKDNQKPTALSLDEELADLKRSADSKKTKIGSNVDEQFPFESFDTGIRGVVFILCTGCQMLVPPLAKSQIPVDGSGASESKKAKVGDHDDTFQSITASAGDTESNSASLPKSSSVVGSPLADCDSIHARSSLPQWNPLEVVRLVVEDIEKGPKSSFPGSRFITRMIPIQATCFSGVNEICHAVGHLVQANLQMRSSSQHLSDTAASNGATFAIQTKIRICGHLKRDQVIESVGKQVVETAPEWKVNLSDPDFTILVEVCKNIAGVSLIPSGELLNTSTRKFNLAELRTKVALSFAK